MITYLISIFCFRYIPVPCRNSGNGVRPGWRTCAPISISIISTMVCKEISCENWLANFLSFITEMNLIFHLKNFKDRSVLLKKHGLESETLIARLENQMTESLTGILHDIVRQKMVDMLISTLHSVPNSINNLMGVALPPPVLCKIYGGGGHQDSTG